MMHNSGSSDLTQNGRWGLNALVLTRDLSNLDSFKLVDAIFLRVKEDESLKSGGYVNVMDSIILR